MKKVDCAVAGHEWRYNASPELYVLEQKRVCWRCMRCESCLEGEWHVPPFLMGRWSDCTLTLAEREEALKKCAAEERQYPTRQMAGLKAKYGLT